MRKVVPSLVEKEINCPYCAEVIMILIEPEDVQQTYVEDCQVCCRPIVIKVLAVGDDFADLEIRAENDVI